MFVSHSIARCKQKDASILVKGLGANAAELDLPATSARNSDTLRPQVWSWCSLQPTHIQEGKAPHVIYHGRSPSLHHTSTASKFLTLLAKGLRLCFDLTMQNLWICLGLSSPEQILACLTVRTIAKQPGNHW